MFNIGPIELLVILVIPFSGILPAVYLSVALRNNVRRSQEQR